MALLYVDEHTASLNRGEVAAGETITEGDLVVSDGSGTFRRADASSDELPQGIVVHDPEGDSIVEHDEEYVAYDDLWTYQEGDRFYWQPLSAVDQVKPRTVPDTTDANGTQLPEPSLSTEVTLGYLNAPSGETRIVESGYTYDADNDGTADTFSESGSGDFVALGRLDKYPQELRIESAYDQRVPTRLDADVFTTSG